LRGVAEVGGVVQQRLHHATMKHMADLLGEALVREHRSPIVGAAHIWRWHAEYVALADGSRIPIGSSYRPELWRGL
jgi:two-component system response regulator LytT